MSEAISGGSSVNVERSWLQWGIVGIVAAVVADVLFNLNVKPGENGGTGPMIGVGVALVVVGLLLYTLAFPRISNASKGALILGIVTFLALGAFWSALPLLLAPAVWVLFQRAPQATPARIGLALAIVAAVLDVIGAIDSAI